MGVLSSFERKLQGAVAGTFARLFGGSVQPTEVADALQLEAAGHLQHQGGTTIAPNRYTVRLGPTDAGGVGQDEERVAAALSSMIREYLDEQGWQTFGNVAVTLEESDALHTGQFRISSLVDPDVGRRVGAREGDHRREPGAWHHRGTRGDQPGLEQIRDRGQRRLVGADVVGVDDRHPVVRAEAQPLQKGVHVVLPCADRSSAKNT